jgi:hypothetical protein
MGYVLDTHFAQFISPFAYGKSAGTWTPTIASNVCKDVRTAGDASFTMLIPITIPSNESTLKGARLKSVEIFYAIGTAAADDFATVGMDLVTLGVDDTAATGAAITHTIDAGHDTAAERLAVDTDHVMTLTITTPFWLDDNQVVWVSCIVDCAATTVFTNFGAVAHFDLRM